jgi:Sec-independent protein translocase protein TatA
VLGPKRLPEVARSVGHGMREMRESFQGAGDDEDEDDDDWRALEDEDREDLDDEAPDPDEGPAPDEDPQAQAADPSNRG